MRRFSPKRSMNLTDAQVSDLASSLVGIVEKFYRRRSSHREREDEELDLTKISVEKDLYKRLYEQLLDRVTVR